MYDPYECPDCDAHRDSPTAACDRCGFDPCSAPADDRALDEWERAHGLNTPAPDRLGPVGSAVAGLAVAALLVSIFLVDAHQADRAISSWKASVAAAVWGGE